MQRIALFAGLLALGLAASLAHASGFIVPDEPMAPRHAPHVRLSPLELRQHQVDVEINDQIATTRVEQVFYNPSRRTVEGAYFFPVPRDAGIDRFTLFMDDQELEAELLPADEAKRIYETIVRQMRDPGLLEYIGQELVRIRIFPIEPNSERRVRLQFTQLLPQDHDFVTYDYPLHGHRHITARQGQFALKATLKTTDPIQTIYSPTHDIDLAQPNATEAVIGMEISIEREDDFSLLFATKPSEEDIGLAVLSYRDPVRGAEKDGYFLLLASPSAKLMQRQEKEDVSDKDVIIVLDTSGSMSRGKLEQAKNALHFILDNLNPGDRFEIVRFSTEVETVFDMLVPADQEHRKRAGAFVDDLRPRGMTAIDDALRTAVTMAREAHEPNRPSVIIFLTDGMPTIGTRDPKVIVSNVNAEIGEATIRIFCFGIGADVNTHLLDHVAHNTRAASQYVLANEDLELKLASFYAKISDPVLTSVALSIDGDVQLSRTYPMDLPDLFAGDQLVLLGRYRDHGEVTIRLSGSVNGEERAFEATTTFAKSETPHEFIPRLWAVRRIGFLLDQVRLHGEDEESRDEITRLAREYGIVTPYTSYLIIEDEANRNVPLAQRSVQTPLRREPGAPEPEPEMVDAELELLAGQFKDLRERQTGDEAVRVAQAADALRNARNVDAVAQANVFSMRGTGEGMDGRIGGAPGRQLELQQARLVRGRAFFQNGDVWVDGHAQSLSDAEPIEIEFGSDTYYDLLEQHPEAAPWLALGRNVQVVLGERIYDIRATAVSN